jgi:hypothetical protein
MHFRFMAVILLHSKHRHVSTTHVAIFRVVRTRIQLQLLVMCQNQSTEKKKFLQISVKFTVNPYPANVENMVNYQC